MKAYTHINVDLDAVASVWFAREFMGARDAELVFVPANWDGDGMEDEDLALDIRAGDRGIKGEEREDGTVHSCFFDLVALHAPNSDRGVLYFLADFVDLQDSNGRAVEWLARAANEFERATLDA